MPFCQKTTLGKIYDISKRSLCGPPLSSFNFLRMNATATKEQMKYMKLQFKNKLFFIIYKCIHSGSYKITYTFVLQVYILFLDHLKVSISGVAEAIKRQKPRKHIRKIYIRGFFSTKKGDQLKCFQTEPLHF